MYLIQGVEFALDASIPVWTARILSLDLAACGGSLCALGPHFLSPGFFSQARLCLCVCLMSVFLGEYCRVIASCTA